MNYLIFGLITVSLFTSSAIAQPVKYPTARVPADSVEVAANRAPEKEIDGLTDFIFYQLHPGLNRRKIRSDETQYINEWAAIKKVVSNDNLVYGDVCDLNSRNYEWLLSKYDGEGGGRQGVTSLLTSPVLDKVADAVFYTRHPELNYRKVQPGETRLVSEWSKIRQGVSLLHPCY
ncbi:hypothetical protein [Tychonema sp. LEGE 07203]|uniref:hypothetical protein n=1 Tax=Microcoleaceae TaxID=1892252 RepID=UPI001882D760|nr:hypothetical protein [Tychonema sp. LEGE 07203]MBE9093670.1 hypothetical protein [Tychonema sp. LEGE 07203]